MTNRVTKGVATFGQIVVEDDRNNVSIGRNANTSNVDGAGTVAIGVDTNRYATGMEDSVVIGNWAGPNVESSGGSNHVIVGTGAGQGITGGSGSIAIGIEAGNGIAGANNVIAIGASSAGGGTQGNSIAIGTLAGLINGVRDRTVAVGNRAAYDCVSQFSVFVGANAGETQTGSDFITAVGYNAMSNNTAGTGSGQYSTAVGANAGQNTRGSYNTAVGADALTTANHTGVNVTCIGWNSQPSTAAVNNQITLGSSSVTQLRCQVTSITALSDARDKTDIADSAFGLDLVNALRPVTFTWNTRDGAKVGLKDVGFIAQELAEVEDELDAHTTLQLTYRDNPEKLEASYGRLVPILVKAVQELSAKVEALEAAQK